MIMILMLVGHFLIEFAFFERSFGNNPYAAGTFTTWLLSQLIGSSAILLGIYLACMALFSDCKRKVFNSRRGVIIAILTLSELASCGLQAAGSYMAASAADEGRSPWPGLRLYLAGQSLQLVVLLPFCFALGSAGFLQRETPSAEKGDEWLKWKTAKVEWGILMFCSTCYCLKAIYQLAMAASGWTGSALNKEVLFILFQTLTVALPSVFLTLAYPPKRSPETGPHDGPPVSVSQGDPEVLKNVP